MNQIIQRLQSLGFTNIVSTLSAGETGDHFKTDQGEVIVNHDSNFVFLNGIRIQEMETEVAMNPYEKYAGKVVKEIKAESFTYGNECFVESLTIEFIDQSVIKIDSNCDVGGGMVWLDIVENEVQN